MHLGQLLPQSTSVSVPFSTPSEQFGVWQVPPVHTLLVQSEFALQPLPGAQAEQPPPPQSAPVSLPFCTPSVHVGV
jgi:hypothetical protein